LKWYGLNQGCCIAKRDEFGNSLEFKLKAVESRNNQYDNKLSPTQGKSQPSELNHSLSPPNNKSGTSFAAHIPPNDISKAPLLILTVLESATLKAGTTYEINAQGLIGSNRKANDGIVYIGLDTKIVNYFYQGTSLGNDIEIPNAEIGMGSRHAQIYYNTSIHITKAIEAISSRIFLMGQEHLLK
jgi:hypothetical protein